MKWNNAFVVFSVILLLVLAGAAEERRSVDSGVLRLNWGDDGSYELGVKDWSSNNAYLVASGSDLDLYKLKALLGVTHIIMTDDVGALATDDEGTLAENESDVDSEIFRLHDDEDGTFSLAVKDPATGEYWRVVRGTGFNRTIFRVLLKKNGFLSPAEKQLFSDIRASSTSRHETPLGYSPRRETYADMMEEDQQQSDMISAAAATTTLFAG